MPYALKCEYLPQGKTCNNESQYQVEVYIVDDGDAKEFAVCGACYDRLCSIFEGRVTIVAHRRSYC